MTRIQTFPMPDVGEGLTEAEILTWHVAVGDTLTVNQVMVEIETAKAAVELPSPYAGVVQALLVEPGITVDVGTPIISIDTDPGGLDDGPAADEADGEEGGAKIGEMMADGRIATLVGYVSAGPATGGRRRRKASVPLEDPGSDVERVPPAKVPATSAASAGSRPEGDAPRPQTGQRPRGRSSRRPPQQGGRRDLPGRDRAGRGRTGHIGDRTG